MRRQNRLAWCEECGYETAESEKRPAVPVQDNYDEGEQGGLL